MSMLRAFAVSLSSLAIMVVAAETQTYRYDVHGRLVAVTRERQQRLAPRPTAWMLRTIAQPGPRRGVVLWP